MWSKGFSETPHQPLRGGVSGGGELFSRVNEQVSFALAEKRRQPGDSGTTVDIHYSEFGFLSRTLTSVHSSHARLLNTLIETRRGVA
jgi:hypothetical protein